MERRCESCKKRFRPHPAVRHQRYCSGKACQKERRKRWQARKRATDAAYRGNQATAQKAWRQRNRGYWSEYRKRNAGAAERNRERQRERNRKRRGARSGKTLESEAVLAPCTPITAVTAGRYRLIPVGGAATAVIAKMDELLVELAVVPRLTALPPWLQRGNCKDGRAPRGRCHDCNDIRPLHQAGGSDCKETTSWFSPGPDGSVGLDPKGKGDV
jgi:hypothetical protein